MPRGVGETNAYPLQHFNDEYLPSYVLNYINGWEQEGAIYESLHSSIGLPFRYISPLCTYHLNQMRGSWVFLIYFVITDCLFFVIIIIVAIYSTLFFFLEIKKVEKGV